MVRTIIHIGQHKTGTTALQQYLQEKRSNLATAGLYVPESLVGYKDPSHFMLNVFALDEGRYSSTKEHLEKTKPADYFVDLRRNLDADISRHYAEAQKKRCKDVIWSNEGLYLLNSEAEYRRLRELFEPHSSEIVCVCCFREKESYRLSRIEELKKQGIALSDDKDSYRNMNPDSWLLDYDRKQVLIESVFDEALLFPYDNVDVIKAFMEKIGYSTGSDTASI